MVNLPSALMKARAELADSSTGKYILCGGLIDAGSVASSVNALGVNCFEMYHVTIAMRPNL